MSKFISDFQNSFLLRLSTEYNQGIIDIVSDAPKSIINFNDVTVLKKGQKYIRHTDLIFNKAIASLFYKLFQEKKISCSLAQDRLGRSIYIKMEQRYIHFMPQEKLIGFPKVEWYKEFNREKDRIIWNTYVVLLEKNENEQAFVSNMNSKVNERNNFVTIEEFTALYLGTEVWGDLKLALEHIDHGSKKYKWFDLKNICTALNKEEFQHKLAKILQEFDYKKEILKCGILIDCEPELHGNFILKERYKVMLGSEDFAVSFFTSEWLFNNYFYDDCLEKTYIVSGYLKSIEQLLRYCISKVGSDSEISIPTKGGFKSISIESTEFYKATLGNMIYFLKQYENKDIFSNTIGFSSIKTIISIINEWVQRERNGYFHKGNIDSVDTVESIRNRTMLLYHMILGSLNCELEC